MKKLEFRGKSNGGTMTSSSQAKVYILKIEKVALIKSANES